MSKTLPGSAPESRSCPHLVSFARTVAFAVSQPEDVDINEILFRPTRQEIRTGDETMPHVIIKLLPGRSEQQKAKIAEEVTKTIMATANCAETVVSVGIEDVASDDWTETVYKPDIIGKPDTIYKKPGYDIR
jgi:4-oxalocrotonate tautomerase